MRLQLDNESQDMCIMFPPLVISTLPSFSSGRQESVCHRKKERNTVFISFSNDKQNQSKDSRKWGTWVAFLPGVWKHFCIQSFLLVSLSSHSGLLSINFPLVLNRRPQLFVSFSPENQRLKCQKELTTVCFCVCYVCRRQWFQRKNPCTHYVVRLLLSRIWFRRIRIWN